MTDGWDAVLDDLAARRAAARAMGGAERLAAQHAAGKLDARQRVDALCDDGSFREIGLLAGTLPADAFVGGIGRVDGRPVAVGAEDFTVAGGSIGDATTAKRHRLAELAVQERIPLVVLLEGAGHRPPRPDDPPSTRRPNDLQALVDASGVVPIAVGVLGSSAGHGALSAPLADFSVMTETAAIFTAGPPLVKASLGEDVDRLALGGPDVALVSGVVHNLAPDDAAALAAIRRWLSYFPSAAGMPAPRHVPVDGHRALDELLHLVPPDPRQAYDMAAVVELVVDDGSWFEIQPRYGPSLLTGLARLGGRAVAVVANQPKVLAGAIDVAAASKAAAFIGVADAFGLPLVLLTDNPGVLAGTTSERAGILRAAATMFAAQRRATVPKLQVTLRKAYGFGSSVMAMNPFDAQTLNVSFPGVTFGAMPSHGADAATGADEAGRTALRDAELASGYRTARGLSIDDVIDPRQLRNVLLDALDTSRARFDDR